MTRQQGLLYTLYIIVKKLAPEYKKLGDHLITETYDSLFKSTDQILFKLDAISEKALKLPKAKRTTHDHCIPRLYVMKALYTIFSHGKNISFKEFVKIVHYLSFQIIITAEENQLLRKNYPFHLLGEVRSLKDIKKLQRNIIYKVYKTHKIKLRLASNPSIKIDENMMDTLLERYDTINQSKLLEKLKM